ncbi:TPA: YopX family protein [Campylobacter coli]
MKTFIGKKNPADINLLKMLVSDKNMSVIGNIHENPELLKC